MARTKKTPEPKKERGKLSKVGALWLKKGQKGTFMSGIISIDENTDMNVLVFKNSYKDEGPRRPDYIVYEPAEADGAGGDSTPTDDDIPF